MSYIKPGKNSGLKFINTYTTSHWFGFNKDGIGAPGIFARTKKAALKKARDIYGKGATVEFYKKVKVDRYKNEAFA